MRITQVIFSHAKRDKLCSFPVKCSLTLGDFGIGRIVPLNGDLGGNCPPGGADVCPEPPAEGTRLELPPAEGTRLEQPPAEGTRLEQPPAEGTRLELPPGGAGLDLLVGGTEVG